MRTRLKGVLADAARARLAQLDPPEQRMAVEGIREARAWLHARRSAIAHGGRLFSGWGVVWPTYGRAELRPIEVPAPGRGQVTVEILRSVVSAGTERANYLMLPHARISFPHRPGYASAGKVLAAGHGAGVAPGTLVAVPWQPHASIATVDADTIVATLGAITPEALATAAFGAIAAAGLRAARLSAGEPFTVVGAGLVGLLTQRLAVAQGAGSAAIVARSPRKQRLTPGTRFLSTDSEADAIGALESPVVIEATGDPGAIAVAIDAAAPGGRVVVLGSPRGVTRGFPLESARRKRLTIVGAHIALLEPGDRTLEARAYLEHVASERLPVDDLLELTLDPREADTFYRRLAQDRELLGAYFDWERMPTDERARRGRFLRVPDVRGRGLEPGLRPLPSTHPRTDKPSPFAGAVGKLNFALLGCGDIAHANAAAVAAAPNAELVACFDPNRRLAEEFAGARGIDVSESAEALIERADVDAVVLSVPHDVHAPLAIAAIGAGKHVIVEKPLANDLAAAVRIAAASRDANVAVSVFFAQRFEPRVAAAHALIEQGAIGELGGSLLTFLTDKPASYWVGGYQGRSTSSWRASRERAGGGILIMNLSHYIDLLLYLGGVAIESVSATTAAVESPGDVEDAVTAALRFANGAIGTIAGCTSVRGIPGAVEMRLWGSDGHVVIEGSVPEVYTVHVVPGLRTTRWQELEGPPVDARAVFVSRFVTAVSEGREVDVTVDDGLAVQAVIEAAYRASALKRSVAPAELLREAAGVGA